MKYNVGDLILVHRNHRLCDVGFIMKLGKDKEPVTRKVRNFAIISFSGDRGHWWLESLLSNDYGDNVYTHIPLHRTRK